MRGPTRPAHGKVRSGSLVSTHNRAIVASREIACPQMRDITSQNCVATASADPGRRPFEAAEDRRRKRSEQPQGAVLGAAQGVVVEQETPDAAVLGEHAGLGLDLLGGGNF